jgi:hypothetical protein
MESINENDFRFAKKAALLGDLDTSINLSGLTFLRTGQHQFAEGKFSNLIYRLRRMIRLPTFIDTTFTD